MSTPVSEIDKVSDELHALATAYAERAEGLASDPYFRDAVVRVAVSNFVWALFDKFDERGRDVLCQELQEQTAAVERVVGSHEGELN